MPTQFEINQANQNTTEMTHGEINSTQIEKMRSKYHQVILQQDDAKKSFGASFNFKNIDKDVQTAVIEGTRNARILTQEGFMPSLKNKISGIPIVGRLIDDSYKYINDQSLKEKRLDEIVDGIFKTLRDKQSTVNEYCESLEVVKYQSQQSHEALVEILQGMQDVDGTTMSIDESNFLIEATQQEIIIRDRILKMNSTIHAAKRISSQITEMIPTLQDDLFNQLALNSVLRSISDMNTQLKNTVEATNAIASENDKEIKNTLIEVTKSINTGDNYKRLNKRNEDFQEFSNKLSQILEEQVTEQKKMVSHIQNNHLGGVKQLNQQGEAEHTSVDKSDLNSLMRAATKKDQRPDRVPFDLHPNQHGAGTGPR